MPRPISYAVFCLKKKKDSIDAIALLLSQRPSRCLACWYRDTIATCPRHLLRHHMLDITLYCSLLMPRTTASTLFPYTTLFRSTTFGQFHQHHSQMPRD